MNFKESSSVELKSIVNDDFKKEVIAFANTNGGEIYVGVDDNGVVVGVDNVDKVMEKIGAIIRNGMLMVNKEATTKKDKDSQPRRYSVQPREDSRTGGSRQG